MSCSHSRKSFSLVDGFDAHRLGRLNGCRFNIEVVVVVCIFGCLDTCCSHSKLDHLEQYHLSSQHLNHPPTKSCATIYWATHSLDTSCYSCNHPQPSPQDLFDLLLLLLVLLLLLTHLGFWSFPHTHTLPRPSMCATDTTPVRSISSSSSHTKSGLPREVSMTTSRKSPGTATTPRWERTTAPSPAWPRPSM